MVRKIISTIKSWGVLFRFILQSDLKRVLWILTYIQKTQGGKESYNRKLPFDIDANPLPWYTYPAIEYLQQFDFKNCSVFEYGSGNSSRFWSGRAKAVTSIESDPDWYQSGLQDLSPNQTLLLKTEQIEYVKSINQDDVQFDLVIIDGMYRFNCAVESIARTKDGGIILLDNSDWYPSTARYIRESGFTQVDFIGAGPVNSYAWCTSIFVRNSINIPRKSDSSPVTILGGLSQISIMDKAC